jgi:hypothetical protein
VATGLAEKSRYFGGNSESYYFDFVMARFEMDRNGLLQHVEKGMATDQIQSAIAMYEMILFEVENHLDFLGDGVNHRYLGYDSLRVDFHGH